MKPLYAIIALLTGCSISVEQLDSPPVEYALHAAGCEGVKVFAYDNMQQLESVCNYDAPIAGCAFPDMIAIDGTQNDEYTCQSVAHECIHIVYYRENGAWKYSHDPEEAAFISDTCKGWR